jgi:hypothetical protein
MMLELLARDATRPGSKKKLGRKKKKMRRANLIESLYTTVRIREEPGHRKKERRRKKSLVANTEMKNI